MKILSFVVGCLLLIFSFQNFTFKVAHVLENEKPISFPISFGRQGDDQSHYEQKNNYSDDARRTPASVDIDNDSIGDFSDFSAGTPGFDKDSRAYYRSGNKLVILSANRQVVSLNFADAVKAAIQRDIFDTSKNAKKFDEKWDRSSMVDDRIVMDDSDRAYTIITPKNGSNLPNAVLLYSLDKCRNWNAISLVGMNAALEQRDGYNDHSGPPSVLSFGIKALVDGKWVVQYDKLRLFSFRFNNKNKLESLFLGGLLMPKRSILTTNHSGGANSTFTLVDKVYVVMPSDEHPDSSSKQNGTPSYICEVEKKKDATPSCKFLGYAGATNRLGTDKLDPDDHDIPAITMDRKGTLKVVLGAHQGMFKLTQSLLPNSIENWSPLQAIGEPAKNSLYGSYTYISLLTHPEGDSDPIVLVSRSEGQSGRYQLVEMILNEDGSYKLWQDPENKNQLIRHRVLVEPNRSFYTAYRQRLALDKRGFLYLHFKYWPNQLYKREASIFGLECNNVNKDGSPGYCWYTGDQMKDLYPTTLKSWDGGVNFNIFSAGK